MRLQKVRSVVVSQFEHRAFIARPALYLCLLAATLGAAVCQDHAQLSSDPQKRVYELSSIISQLPTSQDTVIMTLADNDRDVRNEALKELTVTDNVPKTVRAAVTKLTSSSDPETRSLAISCLAHRSITEQSEIAAVMQALGDPVPAVRLAAIQATAMVDPSAKCPIENLLTTLKDSDTSVQLAGVTILKDIKCDQSPAVPALTTVVNTAVSSQVRTAALSALGDLTATIDGTADLLLRIALQNKDADLRHAAMLDLQTLQSLPPERFSSLDSSVRDPSSIVRQTAAYTLIKLGKSDPHTIALVKALQSDPDEDVRDAVATALRYGEQGAPVFSLVAASLQDKSSEVRLDAAASLLKLKGDSNNSTDNDSDSDAYETPGGEWPIDLIDASLNALNQSESPSLREQIATAVRRYGRSDDKLVARLSELATKDPDLWVRRACVKAVGSVTMTKSTLSVLIASTRDPRVDVRKPAVVRLGKISSEEWPLSQIRKVPELLDIEAALVPRISDPNSSVKLAAINALVALNAESYSRIPQNMETRNAVVGELKDQEADIREAAAKALGSLSTSQNQIDALVEALRDPNGRVRVQAAKSLGEANFSNRRVKQSVGLAPIPILEFVSEGQVIAETKMSLQNAKPKCGAIDALIKSFDDFNSSELHVQEFQSVGDIASNASTMITSLQDGEMPSDMEFIKAANAAVDDCAPFVEKASKFLIQHLDDSDPQLRAAAAEGVGNLQLQGPEIFAALERLLTDNDRAVRKSVVTAMPKTVIPDNLDNTRAATNRLVKATTDVDSDVRMAAVKSLIQLKSLDALTEVSRNPDPEIRKAVFEGFADIVIEASAIEDVVRAGLKDTDRHVRLAALAFLNNKGSSASAQLRYVEPLLKDSSAEIRAASALFLGYYKRGATFAVPDLNALLTDEDFTVKRNVVDSLGWIGSDDAQSIAGLTALITDKDVSTYAKLALERIGAAALPQLSEIVRSSQNKQEAQAAAEIADAIKNSKSEQILTVSLKDGKEQRIDVQSSVVIAVATWCPFSQKLRDFLTREDVKPYLGAVKFSFLLEDETQTVAEHLEKELKGKDWTEEQKHDILAEMRKKVANTGYFDQSFLSTLPGDRYQVPSLSQLAVPAFPSVLAPSTKAASSSELTKKAWLSVHDWVQSDWFSVHVHMPEEMLYEFRSISGGSIFGF